jgi:hypothetical protein
MRESAKRMRNILKRIKAISLEVLDTFCSPNKPETAAIIRKTIH